MDCVQKNPWTFILSLLFIGLNGLFLFRDNYYINAIPFVLIIIYLAIYHIQTTFLLVAFLTPFSVNLEEFTEGKVGLFVPTEPILFGLMLLIIMRQFIRPYIPKHVWRHPITWTLLFYLFWIFITSITSTNPLISFKFLLMKSWFIIPMIFLGVKVFEKKENIIKFLWLISTSLVVIISFTLIRHYGYGFGEKEGHWVMEPFYKDHTIYGSAVAINLFFLMALYFYKKHEAIIQITLILFITITITGLYFSYTRGAWLSVVIALIVWLFIKYKVKFKYLFLIGASFLILLFFSWNAIQIELAKNRSEHTTEKFDERLKSATNITSDASNLERLNRWTAAWRMFLEKPIVGFGPGTYAFEYAPYQDPEKLTIISTNFGDGGNAHSEYLGPLAEMGLMGLITVLLFVIVLFYRGITLYIAYKKDDKELKILLLFTTLAMVTYFSHGFINNYLDTDKAAVPIYGYCAILIALDHRLNNRLVTEK